MKSTIDTLVIFIFSAFIVCIGMLFARTGRNIKSFFAGGEAVPWFIGGLSLFMSFFSAGTFVAWGSIAYKYGWVSVTIQWTMAFGALIAGLFIAPRWKRTGNLTAAEFIEQRLGGAVKNLCVYIFMAVSLFIKGAILYPVAKLVSVSLGFPLMPATIVLGIMMIAYTAVGGLWAVMVTDILQFVILTAAVLIILPLSLNKVGGFSVFTQNAPQEFFNLLNGEYTIWFVLAFGLYHIFYIGGNWTFVQRYTSVDSAKSATRVALIFAVLYVISPVLWMLPPMIYKVINPGLQGLDAENAYLRICQLVLPPGLMGLMLTGMYFSTSATANTTLNVVSAVFTNDVYKSKINPGATDKQFMRVARLSSWMFGSLMIVIALIVPAIGGMVEVVLSVAAVTAGPLLAPPIWALFSKRLSGNVTLWITSVTLLLNLVFKMVLPFTIGLKLNRAQEMMAGVGIPFLLLLVNELYQRTKMEVSQDYTRYLELRAQIDRKEQVIEPEEAYAIKKQNHFGLRVIAFSLLFTSFMILALSFIASSGKMLTAIIAVIIFVASIIPA
ncbi:MAG TPA: sodium:solute symporter family protein, partial [Chitinophagaceae bacterium]|nr:sodium:solute symporter family protein [Chitinophagaceae bacterium]